MMNVRRIQELIQASLQAKLLEPFDLWLCEPQDRGDESIALGLSPGSVSYEIQGYWDLKQHLERITYRCLVGKTTIAERQYKLDGGVVKLAAQQG